MTSAQHPSLTEASSVIRVAIVCEPETTVLVDSLEALLERAKGVHLFTVRISCRVRTQAETGRPLLAPLQRAFPNRPLLVTTTHPEAFDVFPLLEAGAADFLLPPFSYRRCREPVWGTCRLLYQCASASPANCGTY